MVEMAYVLLIHPFCPVSLIFYLASIYVIVVAVSEVLMLVYPYELTRTMEHCSMLRGLQGYDSIIL
jgi:hypothetical protein